MSGNVVGWVYAHYPVAGELDRNRKIILSEVAEAANRDFENAHPGVQTIIDHWGFGRSTVLRHLRDLVADGWLEVTDAGGGRGRTTVYRVCREKVPQWDGFANGKRSQSKPETVPMKTRNGPNGESDTILIHPVILTQEPPPPSGGSDSLLSVPSLIDQVFTEWLSTTGRTARTRLDGPRRARISRALAEYPVEDVLDAVRGWQHSPFHCGDNPDGKTYNDLALLLRDADHIERFRDLWRAPPKARPKRKGGNAEDPMAMIDRVLGNGHAPVFVNNLNGEG